LGYTQSTVTSQIQQLEQELSIKLFEKIGRNMVLTSLGKELMPYAVEEELENGKLKELKAGCSDAKITAIYAYHKNKWISPAMSLFIQLVRESFNIS
jgi:DNA-binding transcriptional LysR family regulator